MNLAVGRRAPAGGHTPRRSRTRASGGSWAIGLWTLACLVCLPPSSFCAETPAPPAPALPAVRDQNSPREFPHFDLREAWQACASDVQQQVLVSCGLWPMPEKCRLNPRIFGRIDRPRYSVERVYFQTLPGFYLAGNLYRPRGRGEGPFPAVLNPHGHWKEGRLTDNADGSVAARCIGFARRGMIAFSYDMVGYNDTFFADQPGVPASGFAARHRHFATSPTNQLWNISLMGLQTWNSLRALDFLASLPDVDRKRMACTGASGGGTQTFMLGAIDDRLAAQAPVVMVSHSMQGGCLCENAPGLRIKYSNMEIAAVPAPRPQILVACTKDWTKDTPTVEGPALQHIYQLFDAPDQLRFLRFDFGHNYNQTSREAVYEWFDRWLSKHPGTCPTKEEPYVKEPDADLRVFPDDKLPEDAASEARIVQLLKEEHESEWQSCQVRSERDLAAFKRFLQPAWRHTLAVQWPKNSVRCLAEQVRPVGEFTNATLRIGRAREEAQILARYWTPPGIADKASPKVVVLCGEPSALAPADPSGQPPPLALALLHRGLAVLQIDRFTDGNYTNQFANFYTTYNRTKAQDRVRDLLTVCTAASAGADPHGPRFFTVILCGTGRAGLWALLAAPAASAVVADCSQLDATSDSALLAPDFFVPGIRNIGTFQGAAILAAPHPVLLHNTGTDFPTEDLRAAYRAVEQTDRVRIVAGQLPDAELVRWLCSTLP